jgi:hypothetical protein
MRAGFGTGIKKKRKSGNERKRLNGNKERAFEIDDLQTGALLSLEGYKRTKGLLKNKG